VVAAFVCPVAGCGDYLTAYHTFKAGHPVDQERGYLYALDGGNVDSGHEWVIQCAAGHLVGELKDDDDEATPELTPEVVEVWLKGRFWPITSALGSDLVPSVTVKVELGHIIEVVDQHGRPVQVNVEYDGPSLWANCTRCTDLRPADELEAFDGAWLCFTCFSEVEPQIV